MLGESEAPKGGKLIPQVEPATIVHGARAPFPAAYQDGMEPKLFDLLPAPGIWDLLRIAWRRKWLLLLGLSLSLLSWPYYRMCVPVYCSQAQVLVAQKSNNVPLTGTDARLGTLEIDLNAHEAIIKSPVVVGRAVREGKLQSLPSFAGFRDPTKFIIARLGISRDSKDERGSAVLTLSYRGSRPDECPAVLKAVVESYQDFLDKNRLQDRDKVRDLFLTWQKDVKKELQDKSERYEELCRRSPLIGKGVDKKNFAQERLSPIETKRIGIVMRRAELQDQLAAIAAAKESGQSHEVLLEMVAKWASRTGGEGAGLGPSAALQEQLVPLLIQEKTLLRQYGTGHPDVIMARQKIKATYQLLMGAAAEPTDSWTLPDPVDLYRQCLQQELQTTIKMEESLAKLFSEEKSRAKEANEEIEKMEKLNGEIKSARELQDQITTQLGRLDLIKDPGGYHAQLISPPEWGGQVAPNGLIIFAVAAVLGVLAGCGLAYLGETADKTFHDPEEIRRALGLPVIGHIPLLGVRRAMSPRTAGNGAALDPVLYAHHQPQSLEAEACRSVRTALCFSTRGEGHKIIQVTSPHRADGKTTLTANLAISIAQSGKQVVVVDVDFRRPRIHKLFGLSGKIGLVSVLAGEAEMVEAIQHDVLPGLSALPCGPIPSNPAELLTAPRFRELLDALRDRYDFVLLDTSPLLAVTDPCIVAPHVDAVLLTLRAAQATRPQAERAKELLNVLQVSILGVVINAVSHKDGFGRYFYEQYRYEYTPSLSEFADGANEAYFSHDGNGAGADEGRKAGDAAGPGARHSSGVDTPHHQHRRRSQPRKWW